jgi:hypothetical protein
MCPRIGWRWRVGSFARDNPLTARVLANRYWEAIFGLGLAADGRGVWFSRRGALGILNCSTGWRWN